MPSCPECDPILQAYSAVGVQIMEKQAQTQPLRRSLEEGLRPPADRLGQAIADRMQAEGEHTAAVQQEAALVAQISAMTGSGAFAVGSAIGNDMSFTPVDGWIEHSVSASLTMWFRNEEAIAQFGKASGLASALDGLAAARARMAATLQALQDALGREWAREQELADAEAQANARIREHYEAIEALKEEHDRLHEEYQACLRRCARGETADQRIGVLGAALMFGGLLVVLLAGMFGQGTEVIEAGGATTSTAAEASGTPTETPTPTATAGPVRIGPIAATFSQPQQTTFYSVPVEGTGTSSVSVAWSGADCGAFGPNGGPATYYWSHPHPPCDATTDHSNRTITARIGVGNTQYECRFQGASPSGFGPPCTGPGGNTAVAAVQATPSPTRAPSTTQPAPTITVTVNVPTPRPSVSPTAAGGGGSTAPTPGATTTAPDGEGGGDEDGEGGAGTATTLGVATTAVGAAALGYATRSRGGGTRTRDEDEEGEGGDETGEGEGLGPTQERPCVTIDTSNRGEDSVTMDQRFRVNVRRPRPASGDPPATVDVKFRSVQTGVEESLRLRWTGNTQGDAEYTSEPVSVEDGGSGSGSMTVPLGPFGGLEFSTGDMGDDLEDIPNGSQVEITIDDCKTEFTVYTTWVQQGIGRSMEGIRKTREFWTHLTTILQSEPDSPEKESLMTQARHVIRLSDDAIRYANNEAWSDIRKLAYVRTVLSIVQSDLSGYDQRNEYQSFAAAEESAERMGMDSLMRGLSGAVIGMWRTAADVTGYASFMKMRYGVDEMGTKVGTLERIFAAIDLAGRLTVYGGTARSLSGLADNVAGQGMRAVRGARTAAEAADDALHTRVRDLVPDRPPVPPRGAPPITRAPAGTRVPWTEDFGMLRNRARHFQSVVERFLVRIRVRPANIESLEWMAEGYPPKHVKLKSKTINELDELIGAPPNSRGLVGHFAPHLPPQGSMPDSLYRRVIDRFEQRQAEFTNQRGTLEHLEEDGLVRLENGLVIDTGLSDMRVPDLRTGQTVPRGVNPGGTGKPFTGDHDMWDITKPDGSPVDAATRTRIEAELMDGTAGTQHGAHCDWTPLNDVERGIDRTIRDSHLGQAGPDGVVGPAQVGGRPTEGLLDFSPGQFPSVSYEMPPVPAGAAR